MPTLAIDVGLGRQLLCGKVTATMANLTRLLGKPPENNFDIPYRKTYFRGDRNDRFEMLRQSDFYTSVFAYGGRGSNTLELPLSSGDISYSSITRGGNISIQFRTAIGEDQSPQTIQVKGVRRIGLLDTTLSISEIYRNNFGSNLPRLPAERQVRWISNGRWDSFEPKSGNLDTLTGKPRTVNNFYLSGAKNDTIIEGTTSRQAVDTLFFDEYESRANIFLRKPGDVNIQVRFANVDDPEETRASLFKARHLERLVFRDAYFERGDKRWRRFGGQPVGTFSAAVDTPQEEQPNFVRPLDGLIFEPIPDDIFDPRFVTPLVTDPLA